MHNGAWSGLCTPSRDTTGRAAHLCPAACNPVSRPRPQPHHRDVRPDAQFVGVRAAGRRGRGGEKEEIGTERGTASRHPRRVIESILSRAVKARFFGDAGWGSLLSRERMWIDHEGFPSRADSMLLRACFRKRKRIRNACMPGAMPIAGPESDTVLQINLRNVPLPRKIAARPAASESLSLSLSPERLAIDREREDEERDKRIIRGRNERRG